MIQTPHPPSRSVQRLFLLALAASGLLQAAPQPDLAHSNSRFGTVRFFVTDTQGRPLRAYEIEILGSPSLRKVVSPNSEIRLPFGRYTINARASLHHSIKKPLVVDAAKSLMIIALPFRDPGLSTVLHSSMSGLVLHLPPGNGPRWVRALSLRGDSHRIAEVQEDGSFVVASLPYGDYLIAVFQGGTALQVRRFSFTVQEEKAIIDLSAQQDTIR